MELREKYKGNQKGILFLIELIERYSHDQVGKSAAALTLSDTFSSDGNMEVGMLHWVQYIRGYVTIKVWGYSTERLLNLCGNHDILVWDIVNYGEYDTMNISVRGFFALKPLLKKTGTRAAVLGKYGLPFFMSKMLRWQGTQSKKVKTMVKKEYFLVF